MRNSMRSIDIALFILIFLFFVTEWALGVFFVPQQANLTYLNEKYVYNGTAFITRYGRKSPYYFNMHIGMKHSWGNNVTIHLVFYEYHINQYKRSFMEIHLKVCDMLERDPFVGKMFQMVLDKYNIGCPIPAGVYNFYNLTLPSDNIPNLLPFEKGKVDFTFEQLPTHEVITTYYVNFIVKKGNV